MLGVSIAWFTRLLLAHVLFTYCQRSVLFTLVLLTHRLRAYGQHLAWVSHCCCSPMHCAAQCSPMYCAPTVSAAWVSCCCCYPTGCDYCQRSVFCTVAVRPRTGRTAYGKLKLLLCAYCQRRVSPCCCCSPTDSVLLSAWREFTVLLLACGLCLLCMDG